MWLLHLWQLIEFAFQFLLMDPCLERDKPVYTETQNTKQDQKPLKNFGTHCNLSCRCYSIFEILVFFREFHDEGIAQSTWDWPISDGNGSARVAGAAFDVICNF